MTESDYWANKANLDRIHADLEHEAKMNILVETQEFNLISILKPKVSLDGNQWCVLYGEDIQNGICGFGDTPLKAMTHFVNQMHSTIKLY